MHGRGTLDEGNGRKYEGEYKEDKRDGFGVYIW